MILCIAEIAAATAGTIAGNPAGSVQGVSTDSRSVAPAELFVPLKGERFDGHRFIPDVAANGVRVVLAEAACDPARYQPVIDAGGTAILVPDTLGALGDLAAAWRRRFSIPIVGVTGSNGKTTTKEMLASILGRTGPGLKTEGNLNNLIGLPQMLFRLTAEHRWAVLEMGMSEPGEIDRLAEMAVPRVGVVLNAFPAHLESMGSVENVARAKGELLLRLPQNGTAVVNADDPLIARQPAADGVARLTFGLATADVTATDIESLGVCGQRFRLRLQGREVPVMLHAFGRHSIYNAMAAAGAALAQGLSAEDIAAGLEAFRPYDKRFHLEPAGGIILIDDSYNANPSSMAAALKTLAELKGKRKAFVALGDMLELGTDQEELHRELGRLAAGVADELFLVGTLTAATAEAAIEAGMAPDSVHAGTTHEETVKAVISRAGEGDLVLVKGSRGMRMERVAEGVRLAAQKTRPVVVRDNTPEMT